MAEAYLGKAFDIHGGGLDLVFPHHENEVAQSKASGADFANFWLHNAWVTMSGEKMSKSLGNSLVVTEVVKRVRPIELRWYLAGAHYRSNLEFGDAALQESAVAFQRIENFVRRASEIVGDVTGGNLPPAYVAAMNDDLNIPAALAVLHETVTAGNTLLANNATKNDIAASLADVRAMLDVIGVDPLADMWAASNAGASEELTSVVEHFVQERIATRQAAKAEKDFGTADAIRDELRNLGIALEDGAEGVRWTLEK
jgi:cysteinyl-tRNA synthetase